MMFVIHPQATQTQHLTVDNRQTCLIDFVWEIPFTDPKYTKIRVRNCAFLVANATKNFGLATRFS